MLPKHVSNETVHLYKDMNCYCTALCMFLLLCPPPVCCDYKLTICIANWSLLGLKPLQCDSGSKLKAFEAYFPMMTSFLLDPAYYTAAYKRHQSRPRVKTDKMLSQMKATETLPSKKEYCQFLVEEVT